MTHAHDVRVAAEFLAQVIAAKDERSACVFLLAISHQVGGEADLGLHFLFAITVVIVRDDGDNDAGFVPAGEFESAAIVVEFAFIAPAHTVAPLAFAGLVPVRETDNLLGHINQVGGQDNAAGV